MLIVTFDMDNRQNRAVSPFEAKCTQLCKSYNSNVSDVLQV